LPEILQQSQNIGISRTLLQKAMIHIEALNGYLTTKRETQRIELYEGFKKTFVANDGHWQMVPIRVPSRETVAKRRPSR
jgi:hypothetical protein